MFLNLFGIYASSYYFPPKILLIPKKRIPKIRLKKRDKYYYLYINTFKVLVYKSLSLPDL